MRIRVLGWLFAVFGLLLQVAVAQAQAPSSGTVYLKNGGFVRGELIELQPGTLVRIKLGDGTVRELPWSEIERVDDPSLHDSAPALRGGASLPPSPPKASGEPAAAPAPGAGTGLALAPQLALRSENAAEIARLRAEYEGISNTGPILMMILGGGTFMLFGTTGAVLLGVGEVCDSPDYNGEFGDEEECTDTRTVGGVLTVIGVVGAVVGIWGLVKLINNSERRVALSNRIEDLKNEQVGLSFDLVPRRGGGSFQLTLRM